MNQVPDQNHPSAAPSRRRLAPGDKAVISGLAAAMGLVAGVAEFMGNGFIDGVRQLLISSAVVVVALAVVVAFRRIGRLMIAVVVIVAAVAAGGIAGYAVGKKRNPVVPPTPDPTGSQSSSTSPSSATPPPPPALARVTFDDPKPAPIRAGSRLQMSGTVKGLATGHHLFVVSKTFASNSDYFVVGGQAVRDRDGRWYALDTGVGDRGDDYGTMVTFTAIDANDDCVKKITAAMAAVEKNTAYRVKNKAWPGSCADGELSPAVVVTLR